MDRSNQEIFNKIYRHHLWIFGSGIGSIYWLNKPFVTYVNDFLRSHKNIKTIVDLGCGDWQIGRNFLLKDQKYIGCDVANEVINKIKGKYSTKQVSFRVLDIVKEEIPKGELVIIKEVLQHLSDRDVKKVLSKVQRYKYVIIGSGMYEGKFINKDIKNGNFRFLDVTQPPFKANKYKLVKIYENGWYKFINILRRFVLLPAKVQGIFLKV